MAGGKLTPKEKLSTYLQLFFSGDSIILSLLLFIIFAAHFFVYYERTAHLRVFGRPYVWLHLCVSLLALYPIMKYHTSVLFNLLYGDLRLRCCKARKKNGSPTTHNDVAVLELQGVPGISANDDESQNNESNENNDDESQNNESNEKERRICTRSRQTLYWMYETFLEFYVVDGKYYIHQMYLCKLYELAYQFYSLVFIYSCSLPTIFNATFAAILSLDSLINCILTWKFVQTTVARDRLLIWHTVADFAYLSIPNFVLYYNYNIPLNVETSIIITIPTTCFILLRILEVMNNLLRVDLIRIKHLQDDGKNVIESDASQGPMKRRFSIFRTTVAKTLRNVETKQFKNFNNVFRGVSILILLFVSLFMLSVALSQGIQVVGNKAYIEKCNNAYSSKEMNVNLYRHCVADAAFCQNLFKPSCDCLHVKLLDYNHTMLPRNSKYMKSLRILEITNGMLQELPENFGFNHRLLVKLHIENNLIKRLPESICSLKNLLYLYLPQNLLKDLPGCIDKLENMVRLVAFRNSIKALPESIGRLRNNLLHILICKSTIHIFSKMYKSLTYLYYHLPITHLQRKIVLRIYQKALAT